MASISLDFGPHSAASQLLCNCEQGTYRKLETSVLRGTFTCLSHLVSATPFEVVICQISYVLEWRNWESEKLSNLPKITGTTNRKARVQLWFSDLYMFSLPALFSWISVPHLHSHRIVEGHGTSDGCASARQAATCPWVWGCCRSGLSSDDAPLSTPKPVLAQWSGITQPLVSGPGPDLSPCLYNC